MRNLIHSRLISILGNATIMQTRWRKFGYYVYCDVLKNYVSTKETKNILRNFPLADIDYDSLTDEELLNVYQQAVIATNTQY